MMHLLPQDFLDKASKIQSIANYSNLELGGVISAVLIYLQGHAQQRTADKVIKSVGSEIRRKNHYDINIARDPVADNEEGAEHISLADLSRKDKISDITPLDLLIKYEQKQQVDDFINSNFGWSEDAALGYFGDSKALSELLNVSRRRAQQLIRKRRDENNQIDLFGANNDINNDNGGDE